MYGFFEIPSWEGEHADIVFMDPQNRLAPCLLHYGYGVATAADRWSDVLPRRSVPFDGLRRWNDDFVRKHDASIRRLRAGQQYLPGESALRSGTATSDATARTAMRLGALELIANIFSGRIAANDKDPFPHQLALQQFMRENRGSVQRLLVADEVGLGKTIEIGLVLRDLLIAKGSLDDFSCVYFTQGGLVEDAANKLRGVLKGSIGTLEIVTEVDSLRRFGTGSTRGVSVASMHAARLYTEGRKAELPEGVAPEIVIIDECHHCASDGELAGIRVLSRHNATLTYNAAHQLITGTFWNQSRPPRLVILMSATPFRSKVQFANLLRLLLLNVDGRTPYEQGFDDSRLVRELQAASPAATVTWRRQDDESVHGWKGDRLFPNLKIIRPHRDPDSGPLLARTSAAYLEIVDQLRDTVRVVARNHNARFSGFAMLQFDKKLTSSSLAGACWLFSWCVRHSNWPTQLAFTSDTSASTESLRTLLRSISQRLAMWDVERTARHADVVLASEKFTFTAREIAQAGASIPRIQRLSEKLRSENDEESFVADADEIHALTRLAMRLLDFGKTDGSGVENAKLNWLKAMLERYPEARFLVFTESLQTCTIIHTALPRICRTLTGSMRPPERETVAAEFRDPTSPVRLLVATSAADEGLDFQVANRVVHWDLSPSPAVLMQRNGRVARLGQVSDVTAYYLILAGTHEERRDRALLDRFAALQIDDERLQLRILGSLSEEEQARLTEAIDGHDPLLVGNILERAKRDNEEMDRDLQNLRTALEATSVLDREALASRLEAWNRLGLPDHIEHELTFESVKWNRPVFGETTTSEPATAKVALVEVGSERREVTFDPEFKVYSGVANRYDLAGLRPWTIRQGGDGVTKPRPDEKVDVLGHLACSLARLTIADFAVIERSKFAVALPQLAGASYLLFATHPMREAETHVAPHRAPYLTFYAFSHSDFDEPIDAGGASAATVRAVIRLLEQRALDRTTNDVVLDDPQLKEASRRLGTWIQRRVKLGGDPFAAEQEYELPVPVALVAIVDVLPSPSGTRASGLSSSQVEGLIAQHHALVDRKHNRGLDLAEQQELTAIESTLEGLEAPFYEPIIARLEEFLSKRGRG